MSRVQQDEFAIRSKKLQLGRLLTYFRPYILFLAISIMLALLIDAAVLVKPYIIKHVIDDYLSVGKFDATVISRMGILYFLVIVTGSLLSYLQTNILTYVGQNIMFKIRNSIFAHIQGMSMAFFDKNSTGRILTRITNDVEALDEIFSGMLINLIRDTIMLIGILVTMFLLDVHLALVSIGCVPIIIVTTFIYRKLARKNFIKMKGMIAKINGFLAESISGMKLIQVFFRQKEKLEELKKLDKEYLTFSFREFILNSLSKPLIDVINNLTIAVLVWYCSGRIFSSGLEIGVLYAFISYIKQFFDPISEIADKYTSIQSAAISSERIFEILDTVDVKENMDEGIPLERLVGDIEFKNVWFAYDNDNWVLKNVSFKIKAGETAAFVGETGSGKSTIIGLMARFYEAQKGEILIDGRNIKDYRLRDLRKNISVVMQDTFLFSGDIKYNIRLNNNDITDEDIRNAAVNMEAAGFIQSLPGGYDEEVRERGCTFSAGQKQLLTFTRAVAFKPSILVLDEATANIDTQTENSIQKAMTRISEGRTVIVIAHRLSTIKNADRIIVIKKGCIIESGKHNELIKKEGIYSQLYKTQLAAAKSAV